MSAAPARRPALRHLPALDGLRGVAVAGILLFHAGHLRGGWLGVDLFFVLSGFLITSLLCAEWGAHRRIALGAFWARRARRLLPALFAMLGGVAVYAGLWADPAELGRIRSDGIATLLYVANWHAIFAQQDYWAMFAAPSPLEHAWSLAIEEQFYALWPILALLLLRLSGGSAAALAVAATSLALASAAAMALLFDDALGTARVYFGTDTRASAVLLGSALAAWQRAAPAGPAAARGAIECAGVLAVGALAVAWTTLDGQSAAVYRGGLLATQLAAVAVLAAAALPNGRGVARWLALPPLRAVGLVSYALYLWHWPVFVWLSHPRTGLDGWALTALRIAVSAALATASTFAIERPIRRGALAPGAALRAAGVAAVAVAAALVVATRPPERPPASAAWPAPAQRGQLDVLLLGDSVAESLAPLLRSAGSDHGLRVRSRATGACTSMPHDVMRLAGGRVMIGDFCDAARASWFEAERGFHPDVALIVEGFAGTGDRHVGGRWLHPCDPAYDARYSAALDAAVARLSREVAPVVIALMPPIDAQRASDVALGGAGVDRQRLLAIANQRMLCQNTVRRAVARRRGARLVDLAARVCPGRRCPAGVDGRVPRRDGLHFSGPAGQEVADWLAAELVAWKDTGS